VLNLTAFSAFHARRTPDAAAVHFGDQTITWSELHRRALRVAAALRERGIGEDSVVALLMKNSPAFLELAFAVSHLGAVLLPVNYRLAGDEVRYITTHAGAALLVADDELAGAGDVGVERWVLSAQARSDLAALAPPSPDPPVAARSGDHLQRLMYTSGTTDHPKGVTISYDNFYWKSIDQVMALGLSASDRLLTVGPLYHVGALDLPGLGVLWMGGSLCVHREFDPVAALESIARHRLTGGWMAPVMTNAVLGLGAQARRFDLSSLRWLIGGGERTPEQRIREFSGMFPGARYIDAYGMTETVSGDTMMEAGYEIQKIGSTGRALAHVEVAILDDDGARLPAGTEGEIAIRGAKVTKGYWRDPEATARSFHDGWLRSGDVGHLDADGFLYLTDRKKDLIISGGENVASSEVERVLYDLQQVSEAAVVGVPDERWGECPVAVVVPRPGASLDFDTVRRHCREHLAGFKVPRELVLRDALPRNPSGKVLKRVLREELAKR
jgi:acyl-CoA synthetase (AMP-forming)/AMP-acid ligase II